MILLSFMIVQCPISGSLDCGPADEVPVVDPGDENKLGTRNPVVLAHGMSGWDELGPIAYFGKVKEYLEAIGFTVYETQTSPFSSVEARVTENFGFNGDRSFLEQIEDFVAANGGIPCIIIGHSMGGLDARYLTSPAGLNRSDLVAAVLTIATPHRGSEIADVALGLLPGFVEGMVDDILKILKLSSPNDDEGEAFYDLHTDISYTFNTTYTNNPDVQYYSIAGKGDGTVNLMAPFLVTHPIISYYRGNNDGLVSVDSSQWGHFLGTWEADHLDEVGTFLSYNSLLGGKEFKYREKVANALIQLINHYNNGTYNDSYSSPEY